MSNGKNETKTFRGRITPLVIAGSKNVFADLNLPRADEALAKAEIAHKICTLIQKEKLNQQQTVRSIITKHGGSRRMRARGLHGAVGPARVAERGEGPSAGS